jgi:hypothetical protein
MIVKMTAGHTEAIQKLKLNMMVSSDSTRRNVQKEQIKI